MTLLLLFPMTAAAIGVPLDAGGAAPRVRQVYYQARFEPLPLGASFPTGWQQPLSGAPPVAKARLADWSLPYSIANVVGVAWQPPLSTAPAVAKAQAGFASAPFAPSGGIAGMAWFTPLWTVPTRNLTAPQGNSSVPYNTAPIVVTTPGQRRPTLFIANLGRLMNH